MKSTGEALRNLGARLAQFVVAVLVGLTIVVVRAHHRRRYVRAWWTVALLLLVLFVAAFVSY